MTLQELRYLVALAKEQHFGRAAAASFVSQPSLSLGIQKLEKELGVNLIERSNNDVYFTLLGKEVVERAKQTLNMVEGIKQLALSEQDQLKSLVKIGAIFTIGPYVLPQLITYLHTSSVQLPVEVYEDYTANLRTKLQNGELDIALLSLPFSSPGIVTKVLYEESFVVLMPKEHPLAQDKIISVDKLQQYNILMLGEGHCFREQVLLACPNCFVTPKNMPKGISWRTVEGTSLETIRTMVASNLGITILPQSAAISGWATDKLLTTRPLAGFEAKRQIAMAWRASFPRTKIIDLLMAAFKQLPF